MAKLGLGKGLDALLGDSQYSSDGHIQADETASTPNAADAFYVDVGLLRPNPHQPRSEFSNESLQELADSIREHGIIQPIVVEQAEDGQYIIIAGERRTRAARLAGLQKVPVYLRKFAERAKLEVALIENIQRENLNPVEEAKAYRKLMEMAHLNQDEVAKRVGKNRSTVANALRLLKLPSDMLTSLVSGELTSGHARALLSVLNPSDQRILFARIVGQSLSVRDAEVQAAELNNGGKLGAAAKKIKPEAKRDVEFSAIEEAFIAALGTKVSLKGNFSRGTIQIDYFSRDDLERLYELITHRGGAQ